MSNYKNKIIDLFGEEYFEDDEEVLESERQLKQTLRNAFGSDSEEDNPSLTDIMELSCSDIEEEVEPTNLTINRITIQPQTDGSLAQMKARAQYQRQMAACVTKQPTERPIQIPPHLVMQRKNGGSISTLQVDTFQSKEELFRTTERMIYGRTLQQVTEEVLSRCTYQPASTVNQPIMSTTPVIATPGFKRSRKEKRMEAKKKWFRKKKLELRTTS